MTINEEAIQNYINTRNELDDRVRDAGKKYYNTIHKKLYADRGAFADIYDGAWEIFSGVKDYSVVLDISWYAGCGEYGSGTLEFPVNYLYDQDNVEEVMVADLKKIQELNQQKLVEQAAREAKRQEEKQKAEREAKYKEYVKLKAEFEGYDSK